MVKDAFLILNCKLHYLERGLFSITLEIKRKTPRKETYLKQFQCVCSKCFDKCIRLSAVPTEAT